MLKDAQMVVKVVSEVTDNPEFREKASQLTIWRTLLDPSLHKEPLGYPLSQRDLCGEALVLFYAGADTSAETLKMGTFHLLQRPDVLSRLKAEIFFAWPKLQDKPRLEDLEKLPYLVSMIRRMIYKKGVLMSRQTAVIKESLRIAPVVTTSLPRIVPSEGAVVDGKFIPGGVCLAYNDSSISCVMWSNVSTRQSSR